MKPDSHSALQEIVRSHQAAMVDLTRDLIAAPTENPPGNAYGQSVDLLCRMLRRFTAVELLGPR